VIEFEGERGNMFGKSKKSADGPEVRFPGVRTAADGSEVVVAMETAASEAAGAYPITPSTQMGEGWALAVAAGKTNVNGRRLIFFEPEGEHAAAAVTAGMSMTGLRSANFSSGQGIAYMHESLYAAAGKRLTYVLNVAARAMTKHALNVHAGHDDYHAVDDTGFFQLFAKDVQEAADLNLIAHRVAELGLTPGLVAQDGFLTSHVIESVLLPERELIKEYLGDPADLIDSPTPAQRHVFGEKRRRIPELFDLDYPAMFGVVQNQDSYAQGVAAQRPFYFDHLQALTDQAMAEFATLTGRAYSRVMGYRLEDAEYVILGQGSVVSNAEAVVDYLRETKGLKVGVINLVMFRPFPSDLIATMLRGKKAVTVLERVDQPLAADAPLIREIRAALSQALENGKTRGKKSTPRAVLPYPDLPPINAGEMPDLYSGGFGFGSRDLQPNDLIAAIENMTEGGRNQRFFYLGIDFIRKGTTSPKLQIWQDQLLADYPDLEHLSLQAGTNPDLHPESSVAIRIHSVGGWGAITTGKNLAMTAFDLFGLYVKANPKYGSEKKGQPTNFFAILSPEPVRLNGELKHVNVVLSPDPNVFNNGEPLAGLSEGGVFVIQTDQSPEALWDSFPPQAQRTIRERNIRVLGLDGFKIASEEASDPDLRYRMQGAAFMGAFFVASPIAERHGLNETQLFEGITDQLQKKFGKRGQHVVDDNVRVIRRGFDEVFEVPHGEINEDAVGGALPHIPAVLDNQDAQPGLGNPGRFWEQVCAYCQTSGEDVIADPFAAVSAIPAATSAVRDMSNIRFEVPEFIADRCTGCSQCWVQCPDAAIPGLVNSVEEILETALIAAQNGKPLSLLKQVSKHVAKESRKILEGVPFKTFGEVASSAYANVMTKLDWSPDRRAQIDGEWSRVFPILAEMPLAKTTPFFDLPERKDPGSGGLLSITVSPDACKGCNICVDVCPEHALITVKQDADILDRLRRNWSVWEQLPDTDDRYINIHDLEAGSGVLSSLLLKKKNYQTMAGGDGACMGCGEKTAVHILVATIEGVMIPRVANLVRELDEMIAGLDLKARKLLASEADLSEVKLSGGAEVDLNLSDEDRISFELLTSAKKALEELRWRYTDGPGGKGRAPMGIANSTGCSSVWGSTYPYNPYPFPWVNHLFQDAPSIAVGIFEGHMRKMADGFIDVRRARLLLDDRYDADRDEAFFEAFEWGQFDDTEFDLCPPILAMGGDGAMLDIGFQNLSRLMASGKPLRVVILDTQVYSNTGGQSCTSGYTGQVADMAAYGKAQHGKTEERKEVAYIAMAHRGTFVVQSSQALPSHMMDGIIKALQSKRPAVINLYTPCPVEHGLPDEWAPHGARLALESRAFPFLIYDPDAGDSIADCLDLSANPAVNDLWPTYTLNYLDDEGAEAELELPVTTADWAATEGRFAKHFTRIDADAWTDTQVPFVEIVAMEAEERAGKTPFVWTLDSERKLERTLVSQEMVQLAEERLQFWAQLRELAGLHVPAAVRKRIARSLESELDNKLQVLRAEYEAKIAELQTSYPRMIARRMAEGLLKHGNGSRTVSEILTEAESSPNLDPIGAEWSVNGGTGGAGGVATAPGAVAVEAQGAASDTSGMAGEAVVSTTAAPAPAPADDDDDLALDPWIDTELCTTCNECTNLNGQMFAYNDAKQAYIKDANAGTFQQIVKAAESCPAEIIHPGTPLDPDEPDLEKWIERAERFN
jgi:pyruvate-ferredoxin/flavodoxin oxidoreductase